MAGLEAAVAGEAIVSAGYRPQMNAAMRVAVSWLLDHAYSGRGARATALLGDR
jgi:hypothetical protein